MNKKIFLSLLSSFLISPALADQCPEVKINTLFPHLTVTVGYTLLLLSEDSFSKISAAAKNQPILVKKADGTNALWGVKNGKWQLTPLDNFNLPSGWQDKQKVQVDPNNTAIFAILEKGHSSAAFKEWNVTINDIDSSFSTKYLNLDNVAPFETHVTTNRLDKGADSVIDEYNRNQSAPSTTTATVTLATCEYGLFASDLYLKLYPTGKPSNNTLIVLKPKLTQTMSVASILNGNTGWAIRQKYPYSVPPFNFVLHYNPAVIYWFDCSHDNVTDSKCTWQAVSIAAKPSKSTYDGPAPSVWY